MTRYEMRGKDGRTVEFFVGRERWKVISPLGYRQSGCYVRWGIYPGWAWKVSKVSERKMFEAYNAWYEDGTYVETSLLPWEV